MLCKYNFCCTTKRTSHMYTYIPSLLELPHPTPSVEVITEHRAELPMVSHQLRILHLLFHIHQSQSPNSFPHLTVSTCLFPVSVSLFLSCKDVEKRKPSCTVGGYINQEQYGGSLKTLRLEPLYDPAIQLLGIYLEKTIIQKETCTPLFIAALFTIYRTWKQLAF